jgi:hypothetical protein
MKPEVLEAGYPRLDEFKAIVKKYNPDGKLRSVQSDRLLLTPGMENTGSKMQVTGTKEQVKAQV